MSVGRLKRCETKSCVMISLFAAADGEISPIDRSHKEYLRLIAAIFAISLSVILIVRHAAAAGARQRSCWSASVASANPGAASVTRRLSSSPAKQMAAKASRSGSATIETTPSQTFGFRSIRRSTASTISRSVRQYELLIAASMLARPAPISAAALASDRAFRAHNGEIVYDFCCAGHSERRALCGPHHGTVGSPIVGQSN